MENEIKTVASAKASPLEPNRDMKLRLYRWTVFTLIFIALAILVWKVIGQSLTVSAHEEAMALRSEEAKMLIDARTKNLIATTGMALEASVRRGLRTDDYTTLREVLRKLKREAPLERAFVANVAGDIRAASDPAIEGMVVEPGLRPLLKSLNRVTIDNIGEGRDRLLMPVFDGSRRIGVLVMIFEFLE